MQEDVAEESPHKWKGKFAYVGRCGIPGVQALGSQMRTVPGVQTLGSQMRTFTPYHSGKKLYPGF